jgi:hypothetical protein
LDVTARRAPEIQDILLCPKNIHQDPSPFRGEGRGERGEGRGERREGEKEGRRMKRGRRGGEREQLNHRSSGLGTPSLCHGDAAASSRL